MADFFNNLTSINWWIGVFVVTIVLNVLAMYLKSPIDRFFSSISTKYQTRTKAKKAEREKQIVYLVGNKQEQILYASKINFTLIMSGFSYLIGISLTILPILIDVYRLQPPVSKHSLGFGTFFFSSLIFGSFMVLRGCSKWGEAFDDQRILKEAKDRESKIEGSS